MALFARPSLSVGATPNRLVSALEAALRVSEIASSAMALSEAVQAMVQTATHMLGAEQGSIMLLEEDGRHLVLMASHGITQVPVGHRVPVGEGVAGRVLATGTPLLLSDVNQDQFVNFVPKSRPISSSIVVAMRSQGRPLGVLNLAMSHSPPAFTEDDVRIAQMFADQAAGLIYRARLHERAEHRSTELLALVESSKAMLGTLNIDALLQRALDDGSRLAGSKDGFACLFDPRSGAITKGVFRGIDKETIRTLLTDAEMRKAIDTREVASLQHETAGRLVAVGLATSQGTKGVIVVGGGSELAEERSHLLRAFAQQCASAVGAAELYALIERKESELSSIIQAVPNPIVMVDAHGAIVAVNPAAEELFGVSASFSAGAPAVGTIGHEEVEKLLTTEGELQNEVLIGTPPRTYRVRVNDVRVPGGPMGRVLIMDDVTSEREMAQVQRDFVAMIGHELRTPLTIVKGFARTLLKRIEKASAREAREALTTIDNRAAQLERLIEDLLYVSQIETREAALRIEQVDVNALVATIGEELLQEYPGREIALDIPPSLIWPSDETKVGLILRHLLENALKYSEAPNPVTVSITAEDGELRVDVVDKGVGLVSGDIPHIFDRFHQVDNSSTREHGGTGVGLYLCAQLIRAHGGRIWVDSAWGKGSTFSFSLPRRTSPKEIVDMKRLSSKTA